MLRPIFRNIFIISRRYAPARTKLHDNNTLALCIIDYQRARISYAARSYVGNGSVDSHQPKCNCLFIRRRPAFFKLKFLLHEVDAPEIHKRTDVLSHSATAQIFESLFLQIMQIIVFMSYLCVLV